MPLPADRQRGFHLRQAGMPAGVEVGAVTIQTGDARIVGDLARPANAAGMVVFAHGSGSSRRSPRNRAVAAHLCDAGFATLLLDLLTEREERHDTQTGELRFDIGLLARRLTDAVDWVTGELRVGLFGASTGAAAALVAAARRPERVGAVVSRGGRPDLAEGALPSVKAPVQLIVGGRDDVVIRLNNDAATHLRGPCEIQIVQDAGHLFEEPGALEQVATHAERWFRTCLSSDVSR